jgi:prepilin-type N-terminal cleavage/methylation domain-containing protein
MKSQKGFTLIELLVVIAIIGILSSVVLASLNSARQKGQIAAIKSNLKNMIPQAELTYEANGNYSTACASLANIITAINNVGGTASCYSHAVDGNVRWGVSAKLNSDTSKNWAVDGMGVVAWDTSDASATQISWSAANTACSNIGGRLPSYEQLNALYLVYGTNPTPGFISVGQYWSGTTVPSDNLAAYDMTMATGNVYNGPKINGHYVRCVH